MTDSFNENAKQASGSYSGDYLWSTAGNWSTGLPAATDAVLLNLGSGTSAVSTNVTVASVTYNTSGLLLIGGALTTGSVTGTGVGDNLTVQAGGSLSVTNTLQLQSSLDVEGNASIATLIAGSLIVGGTATVGQLSGGTTVSVNQPGVLEVTTGIDTAFSSSADIFKLSGGILKLDNNVVLNTGTTFTFGTSSIAGASSVYIGDLANLTSGVLTNSIKNFDVGDSLQFGTAVFTSASFSTIGNVLTLTGTTNYYISGVTFASDVGAKTFGVTTAANGGTIITLNCFLSGTRIETPTGAAAIESLSEGDLVLTLEGGARVARPIRWIGGRKVDPARMDADAAREAAPVRICAHALAENIPARDLLVTADHCILEAGMLIPARMLVNGTSILRDGRREAFSVYHIAFETHSILFSEGLTTESFLDTGNTGFADLPSDRIASWDRDAAAPLTTARDAVEPVWRRLAARAEALGFGSAHAGDAGETTTDPALSVQLADGRLLRARRLRGKRHFFVLPAGQAGIVLHSRSAVPACMEGPFVDDRRQLGVCIAGAVLWTDLRSTALALGGPDQSGWHAPEARGGACWTDGAGVLALPLLAQPTILEIEVEAAYRYPSCTAAERLRA